MQGRFSYLEHVEQGAKEKHAWPSIQLAYTRYTMKKSQIRSRSTWINLPVMIVSSSALFMRSIAFSLVGAHTISYKNFQKSGQE